MRIVIAAEIFPPDIGGPASYSESLALALHAEGFAVSLVCYSDRPDGPEYPFPIHRIIRRSKLGHYRAYVRKLRELTAAADIIYAQGPIGSGLPAWWASRTTGVPYVVKVVGDYAWEAYQRRGGRGSIEEFQRRGTGMLRRLQAWTTRRAGRVIVPSRYLAGIVAGWGVPHERISVVYNAFGPPAVVPSRNEARGQLGLSGKIVVSVGRLVPWKGFNVLIAAVAQLNRTVPDVRLVIIGDGSDQARLERLAQEHSVADRVTLTGRINRDQVFAYVAAADVFALLSRYEGLPHTVLEAMAARTPAVVSAAGGNREVVEDGVNGLVVDATPEAAADAIQKLMADPALRERLAANAFMGLKQFSFERMVEETISVLNAAVKMGNV